MHSNFISAASTLSASSLSVVRTVVQVLRRWARRNPGAVVVAAVVVLAGLGAGLLAALVPSGSVASLAAASNTARAPRAAGHAAATAAGSAAALPAVKLPAVELPAVKLPAVKAAASKHAAKPAPAHKAAKPAKPARPYSLYDSVTPSLIPGNHPIATYATGNYAVSPSQVRGKQVIWIDTNGSAPAKASVLDIEPGNVPPSAAAGWAKARLTAHPHGVARIYTMRSEWGAAKASIHTLPGWMRSHVKWWIADPTGVQHVVPGSNATQWYWGRNYDISIVEPGF